MTVHEFIAKWRKVELKERSAAQEHFLDLCRVFDHPTPAAADPTGESFCFEKGAAKHGGGGTDNGHGNRVVTGERMERMESGRWRFPLCRFVGYFVESKRLSGWMKCTV